MLMTMHAQDERDPARAKGRREEYTEATRHALMTAGRDAFAGEGYQAAGIEAISRAARVTRGAFYHHFADKQALFDAVVMAMQQDAAQRIAARAKAQRKIWDRLGAGIDAYLDVCLEPAYARIVIQDAPAVLGRQRYREIDAAHTLALLGATFDALKARGELQVDDPSLLTHMVDAMICEMAQLLPQTKDAKALRERGKAIISRLLETYRAT